MWKELLRILAKWVHEEFFIAWIIHKILYFIRQTIDFIKIAIELPLKES